MPPRRDPPLFDLGPTRHHLARHGPRRGYLCTGPAVYLHRLLFEQLKAHYGPEAYEVHFCPKRGDQPLPLDRLLAELISPGLFGDAKLVILLDATATLLKDHRKRIVAALTGSGPGTLAISMPSGTVPSDVRKAFVARGEVHKTRKLYERPGAWVRSGPETGELARWLVMRARELGSALEPRAAWELICRVSADLAELDGELEKLVLGRRGAPLDMAAVRAGVAAHRGAQALELADQVLSGDRGNALAAARRCLLETNESPEGVLLVTLAILRRELASMIRALDAAGPAAEGRGAPTGLLVDRLGMSKWQADRLSERLRRLNRTPQLLRLRHVVYEADRDMKQGRVGKGGTPWLIERVIDAFCPAMARR